MCVKYNFKSHRIVFIQQISHRLKKIGKRVGVRVMFSAPFKLISLTKSTNPLKTKSSTDCRVQHRNRYATCSREVVYGTPLSCGACYVGTTGRCLNNRLREHANNVKNGKDGFLAQHCTECKCVPLFEETATLYKHRYVGTRVIVEAAQMAREQVPCVSKPSVALFEKERRFLEGFGAGR